MKTLSNLSLTAAAFAFVLATGSAYAADQTPADAKSLVAPKAEPAATVEASKPAGDLNRQIVVEDSSKPSVEKITLAKAEDAPAAPQTLLDTKPADIAPVAEAAPAGDSAPESKPADAPAAAESAPEADSANPAPAPEAAPAPKAEAPATGKPFTSDTVGYKSHPTYHAYSGSYGYDNSYSSGYDSSYDDCE